MKKNHFLYLLCPLLLLSFSSWAQKTVIRGFVYESETGEPCIFTNVYLPGTTFGATTDVNGYFKIRKIPPGTHTLVVTCLGYDTLFSKVTIAEGQILNQKLFVKKSPPLPTIYITPHEYSIQKISPKDIKRLPTIGSEKDLQQYSNVLGCWGWGLRQTDSIIVGDSTAPDVCKQVKINPKR